MMSKKKNIVQFKSVPEIFGIMLNYEYGGVPAKFHLSAKFQ